MQVQTKSYSPYILIGLIVVGVLLPLTRLVMFAFSSWQPQPGNSVMIEVYRGENPNEIAKNLTVQGVIGNTKEFILFGRLTRQWKKIKTGEYRFSSSMTPIEIFSILSSGISVGHPLTVREGENMYEIAADLESKGLIKRNQFISLSKDASFIASLGYFKEDLPLTLEGYFFPDTYLFNRTMNEAEMIRQMVKHFFSYWGKAQDDSAEAIHLKRHQVVTLASIIEKETGAPEERPIISSVFFNRLLKGMKLQSDPTTIYGMWETFHGKIHRRDLFIKNNYNTYSIQGLPIGPIANPGKDAIEAALHPSKSEYLFFVSHNDGTHQFSRTLQEHNLAVKKFQLDPKAREGKSWRDLLKKNSYNH